MPDNVVHEGDRHRYRWAIRSNSEMPAKEFYEEKLSDTYQARLMAYIGQLDATGKLSKDKFKKLTNTNLWEFRLSPQIRLLSFFAEYNCLVITHGFIKKQQKTPRSEIETGERIREEHLERCEKCDGTECV